jgi:thioredoxin 1
MGVLNWLGITNDCEKEPLEITDLNFVTEVRQSKIPVVLDVWSNGCAPCMQLVPTIRRLACKYDGKIKIAQLNVGNNLKTAQKLGVRGTPTVLFFKNGAVVERVVGVRGQHYFEDIIETDLLPSDQTKV